MHPSVKAAYHAFSKPLEGRLRSMYVDVKNLVTTGVGNLIDPVSLALALPWKHSKTGQLATKAEISAAWAQLKNHPGFALQPGGSRVPLSKLSASVAASLNDLRLDDADIDALIDRQLALNEAAIRKHSPEYDTFPADAQLGMLSMSWAVGGDFERIFSNFAKDANLQRWDLVTLKDATGGYPAKIRETNNPGIVPRNAKNCLCFANAQIVHAHGMDVTELHWPNAADAPAADAPVSGSVDMHLAAVDAQAASRAALNAWTDSEYAKLRNITPADALRAYEQADA